MDRNIRSVEDVLRLLDRLFSPEDDRWSADGSAWWDGFYADRDRPVPFFAAKPDESLVSYAERGLVTAGPGKRALELGCGPGRNAIRLASLGYEVDAVDLSPEAIAWAEERAREAGADVRFHRGDVFELLADTADTTTPGSARGDGGARTDGGPAAAPDTDTGATRPALGGPYDLVYDSGCFHHLPPHRRISYLSLLGRALAPGGHFALTCFAAGAMGSELPDADFYQRSRPALDGGLAYTPESLRRIFSDLTEIELRRMQDEPPESPHFGEPFLWTALFRRDGVGKPTAKA